jgi:hypothetical protein
MIGLFINIIVWLLVLGILYWLAIYVIDAIPLPQPANRVAKLVLTVLVVLVVILLLLQVIGVDVGSTRLPGVAPRP